MLPPDDAPGEARRSAAHMHGHGPGANVSQGDNALLPLCSALSSRVVAACLAHRPNEPISHGHQGTRPFYGAPADRAVYWFAVAAWNAAACSAPRPGAAVADV